MQIIPKITIEWLNINKVAGCRLTALAFDGKHPTTNLRMVDCLCSCGNRHRTTATSMKNGSVKSCGCLRDENRGKGWYGIKPHIKELKILYRSMYNRCYRVSQISYPRYGGRGVRMCDEWLNSYQSFLDWAIASGWESGLCLDKDILGNGLLYSPSTCKWVTHQENNRNRRNTVKHVLDGREVTLGETAERLNIGYQNLYAIVRRYGIEKAIVYFSTGNNIKYPKACTYFRHHYNKIP